jgi:hypothetical protein
MPRGRGLCHVALSISCLSPMVRRPEALLAMNMASLIFRPDLGFLTLTSFQSFNRPSLSFGSSSRISLRRQSFSVSRPRLRPPGNIHNRSRLLLTNNTRPRFAAMSFDAFAITILHAFSSNHLLDFISSFGAINRRYLAPDACCAKQRFNPIRQQRCPKWVIRVGLAGSRRLSR